MKLKNRNTLSKKPNQFSFLQYDDDEDIQYHLIIDNYNSISKQNKNRLNSIDNFTLTSLGLSRSPAPSASIYLLRSIGRNSRYKHKLLQPPLYDGSNAT
jgi:hypothetical protein